jgi:hypothetical protein
MDKAPRKPRRKDRVLAIEKRGEYIRAQFELDGEVVIGEYKRFGWARPPRAERAEFERILNSPPLVSYSTPGVRSAKVRHRAIDAKREV